MKTIKEPNTIEAILLANYILKNFGPMSHLKLQKILFYCDAYHRAYFSKPLINEGFEAWVHGPVCRIVFDSLKQKSVLYSDIKWDETESDPNPIIEKTLSSSQITYINEIINELKTWNDFELEAATHREEPWRRARKNLKPYEKCSNLIDTDLVEHFYRNELELNDFQKA